MTNETAKDAFDMLSRILEGAKQDSDGFEMAVLVIVSPIYSIIFQEISKIKKPHVTGHEIAEIAIKAYDLVSATTKKCLLEPQEKLPAIH